MVGLTVTGDAVLPQISFSSDPSSSPLSLPSDLLLVAVSESDFADGAPAGADVAALDAALDGALADLASDLDFKAKPGQLSAVLRVPGQPFKRLALIGLGKAADVAAGGTKGDPSRWHSFGASVASAAKAQQAGRVVLAMGGAKGVLEGAAAADAAAAVSDAVRALVVGATVNSFEDVRFKSDGKEKERDRKSVV